MIGTTGIAGSQSVNAEDLPFQHYTPKQRVIAWISQHLFDWTVYTVRRGMLSGLKRRGGLGWAPGFLVNNTETREDHFLQRLADEGVFARAVVVDGGAFHGIRTLFFVRHGATVIAYEPTGRNFRRLEQNLILNDYAGKVNVRKVALGETSGQSTMTVSHLMPGGASLDANISRTILEQDAQSAGESVRITTLDLEVEELGLAPTFIKLDIEGYELQALRGAQNTLRTHKPGLFIEMHGETMREKKSKVLAIVRFLHDEFKYHIVHVESQAVITSDNSEIAARGHLYCT